jgi:hypothetical protein
LARVSFLRETPRDFALFVLLVSADAGLSEPNALRAPPFLFAEKPFPLVEKYTFLLILSSTNLRSVTARRLEIP